MVRLTSILLACFFAAAERLTEVGCVLKNSMEAAFLGSPPVESLLKNSAMAKGSYPDMAKVFIPTESASISISLVKSIWPCCMIEGANIVPASRISLLPDIALRSTAPKSTKPPWIELGT